MSVLEAIPILQLVVASLLAGVIGLERQLADEAAGLRTHLLVGLGACLFALASAYGLGKVLPSSAGGLLFPTLAAQIVTGIGFLGAGAILRSGIDVRGLATAASLWVVAGLGIAVAFGHYAPAVACTLIAILTLRGARRVEAGLLRRFATRHVEIDLAAPAAVGLEEVVDVLEGAGALVRRLGMEEVDGTRTFSAVIEIAPRRDLRTALTALRRLATVTRVSLTA
jgi:putative Mg2+ transporter-C (MgtC) family protein